jgi:hypothetical protein
MESSLVDTRSVACVYVSEKQCVSVTMLQCVLTTLYSKMVRFFQNARLRVSQETDLSR